MAKFGLPDRLFRFCNERDNLRAHYAPDTGPARRSAHTLPADPLIPVRNAMVALVLGLGVWLSSTYLIPQQAHAADSNWWALGTFLQPLNDRPGKLKLGLKANIAGWAALQDANMAASAGDLNDAKASFTRAVDLYGPESPLRSELYTTHARSLHAQGHYLEAIRTLDELVALEPKRPDGYWARAHIHMGTRAYDKALSDYEKLIKLSPNLVGAHMKRGLALYHLRRSDLAVGAFQNAMKAVEKRYVAISVYWSSSEITKSTPGVAKTMLSLLDRDRDWTIAEAHLWLGKTHFRRSRFWEALRSYEQAIKFAPDYDLAYKYRGWLNEKMGHIPAARADYRTAANLNQDDPWVIKALRRVR